MSSCRSCQVRSKSLIRLLLYAPILAMGAGCTSFPVPTSATLEGNAAVAVSADQSKSVALGTGAAQLANSVWAMYRQSDDTLIFRVRFGSTGEIVEIFDNFIFAQPWLGSLVVPDGLPHPTAFPFGQYVSGGYVAEDGNRVGVLGVLHGILLGQHLGTATLGFFGTRTGDRIDGTMTRTVMIFGATPFEPPGDAQFDAYALREE